MLTETFYSLLEQGWKPVFAQKRSRQRAISHAIALIVLLGRCTISRIICALGGANHDWSADYKIYSRSPWNAEDLFDPVIDNYLVRYPEGPIRVAYDDTKLKKTGKKIKNAFWQRDPMSPAFHLNFIYGLRFVQASLLFPHYQEGDFAARGYPVAFQDAPAIKKPGKRASEQEIADYKQACKQQNLSLQTLNMIRSLRQRLDQKGAANRILVVTVDGSFCNQTFFKAKLDRIQLVARCRKDASLCFPAPEGSRRRYDPQVFTPEQVRQKDTLPWQQAHIYFGRYWRDIRYKEVRGVLWQRGAGTKRLRLIVIAPMPYKLSEHARTNYRDPAFLLTTDLETSVVELIQAYFDRWQIEVNHRDEKDLLGVGQAQVWSQQSIPRHPAFAVACYSLALLAALLTFGPGRTSDYLTLPKWRKHSQRPSYLDILTIMRKEYNEMGGWPLTSTNFAQNLTLYANT
jgi:hypothetical protein